MDAFGDGFDIAIVLLQTSVILKSYRCSIRPFSVMHGGRVALGKKLLCY